ncbi:hypothetical protein KSP39_PZI016542 [Platanthera zijinensis]|uniref:Uncharacterized protein n=1 Tax=Platanthera zijinensis TaxID=2320716 RepID=A0AAP0B7D0_9ASPA
MSGGRSMNRGMEHHKLVLETYSSTDSPPPPPFSSSGSETEEEPEEEMILPPPTTWRAGKRVLSKQLSMRETRREVQWEKRRRQMYQRSRSGESRGAAEERRRKQGKEEEMKAARVRSLTDEDLEELRGSIELGFGFNEEDGGQQLCRTLPALNLYFAVKRQLSDPKLRQTPSPESTPTGTATAMSSASTLYGTPSPRSPDEPPQQEQQGNSVGGSDDTWKIFKPGDSPQHVKTRLRHWAQIVACSVRQCC